MKESRKSIRVDAQLFISYDILDKEGKVGDILPPSLYLVHANLLSSRLRLLLN